MTRPKLHALRTFFGRPQREGQGLRGGDRTSGPCWSLVIVMASAVWQPQSMVGMMATTPSRFVYVVVRSVASGPVRLRHHRHTLETERGSELHLPRRQRRCICPISNTAILVSCGLVGKRAWAEDIVDTDKIGAVKQIRRIEAQL